MGGEEGGRGKEGDIKLRKKGEGTLTKLGYAAPATGTGLDQLTSVSVDGPSVTLESGVMVVPVTINMP